MTIFLFQKHVLLHLLRPAVRSQGRGQGRLQEPPLGKEVQRGGFTDAKDRGAAADATAGITKVCEFVFFLFF